MRLISKKKSSPGYRADIDGLRGIAVLLVLAFHLGTTKFSGGFIGVDVFFVISGYLISSIILAEIDVSKFSLLSFYERRIRRIVPALFVMMGITSLLAYKFFLPAELEEFAKSLLAGTFSFSNIYFFHQSGYFDGPAAMKPLLHTWSLAVEEQFYIFLPLFLIAVRRFFPDKQRILIISAAVLSFCVSVWGAFQSPSATFYLAHTRAWELLLGTMVTLDVFPSFSNSLWRNTTSIAGLALILVPAIIYDKSTPFPGLAAAVPCFGAALIIAAGRSGQSAVGRLLSLSPVVFVGLISYSLYLWHWPLIVFQDVSGILAQGIWPKAAKFVVLAASFIVAILSWRFVERPFRDGRVKFPRNLLFQIAATSATFLLVFGASAVITRGFPIRFPPEAVRVASFLENADAITESQYRVGTCFLTSRNPQASLDSSVCLRQDSQKPNELLIGDSHAAQLWYGLSSAFRDVNLMQATASGCKPTLEQGLGTDKRCRRMMEYVFHDYLQSHHIDAILIAARWDAADLPRLERTVVWLQEHGIPVILFGPTVQYDSALPRLLALAIQKNDPRLPAEHRVPYYARLDKEMAALAETKLHVRYISYFKLLCQQDSCLEYAAKGVPLQSDYGHLTGDGSSLVAARIRDTGGLNQPKYR